MPLKKTEDGKGIAFKEEGGKVLITQVDDAGKETDFNAEGFFKENPVVRQEAKDNRVAMKAAESNLAALKAQVGDLDLKAAGKAVDTVKNLLDKDGKMKGVDEAVQAALTAAAEKHNKELDPLKVKLGLLQEKGVKADLLSSAELGKTIYGKDDLHAIFGKYCNSDGTFTDRAGNVLNSVTDPGKPAGVDEAAKSWISTHPDKDSILKADYKGGGGGNEGEGGNKGDGGEATTYGDIVGEAFK